MKHFINEEEFNKNMQIVQDILEEKGYVLESDHPYAYSMRHSTAVDDVKCWLEQHGYEGKIRSAGAFNKVAVYGLYDEDRISYDEMYMRLQMEADFQNQLL